MKPSDAEFMTLMQPMQADYKVVEKIKDSNRSNREWSPHFQTVADGAGCVGWLQLVSSYFTSRFDLYPNANNSRIAIPEGMSKDRRRQPSSTVTG